MKLQLFFTITFAFSGLTTGAGLQSLLSLFDKENEQNAESEILKRLLSDLDRSKKSAAACGVQSINDDGAVHEPARVPYSEPSECRRSKRDTKDELWRLLDRILIDKKRTNDKRVVGGHPLKEGMWPWMVSFFRGDPYKGMVQPICGATLIAPRWALTAAHCVKQATADPCGYSVQLGENTLLKQSSDAQFIPLDRIIKHKDYKAAGANDINDVALLRLSQPANIASDEIGLACLINDQPYDMQSCSVAGWGINQAATAQQLQTQQSSLSRTKVLQHLKLPQLPPQECAKRVAGYDPVNICVSSNKNRDVCSGDSGGPYICRGNNGIYYDVGVASFVQNGCALDNAPAIYVSVRYHRNWIKDVIDRYGGM